VIFIDTNVFYHFATNGEFADLAEEILTSKEPKVASDTIVDEFLFIIIKREVKRNFGMASIPHSALKRSLQKMSRSLSSFMKPGSEHLQFLKNLTL